MPVNSRCALFGTPYHAKPSLTFTPRVDKPSKGVATPGSDSTSSSLQNVRLSTNRSPPPVTSNPTVENPSPKLITPPDKKATRIVIPSEFEAELSLAKKDLKKANKKLVLMEQEKAKALSKMKRVKKAHKLSKEENEKLREAQKRAGENSEIGKCRAIELEQASIEAFHRKEEKWQKELEEVKKNHARDLIVLSSATHELRKAKQELATTRDAEHKAFIHADEMTEIAEATAKKVLALIGKTDSLTRQLENSKIFEAELVEKCLTLSGLKSENENYKTQIEDLKSVLEAKNEKYENMLGDAKGEINVLTNSIKRSKQDYDELKSEMEKHGLHLTNTLKRSEEEKSCMEFEISRLANLLKKIEKEARVKEARWKKSFEEANSETTGLKKVVASEVKAAESSENELDKNGSELTDSSEKEYDVIPKWTSSMEINEKHAEVCDIESDVESLSGKLMKNGEEKEEEEEESEDYFSEVDDLEMWESFEVDEKDSYYTENDANGVMMKKKKKKPLLGKIGSLLKKKR